MSGMETSVSKNEGGNCRGDFQRAEHEGRPTNWNFSSQCATSENSPPAAALTFLDSLYKTRAHGAAYTSVRTLGM